MICDTVMGMPPGPKLDELRADYGIVLAGFASLPIPLPGTAYTKAKRALNRILAVFDENIRQHQQQPRDDGLSRILATKSPTSGRTMTGWRRLWGHRSSHVREEVYVPGARAFDSDRFAAPRCEHQKHEHAFVPNGAGPESGHKCAGVGLATYFLQLFAVELVRGCSWQLSPGATVKRTSSSS